MNIPGCGNALNRDDASFGEASERASGVKPLDAKDSTAPGALQKQGSEVGVVPQLDPADFTTTLAPYVPTWTHPYERFPEPSMGWLGELPPDLFTFLMSNVPLADAAMLGRVSRSLSAVVNSTNSPYAALLPLVEQAWTDDIDIAHIVRMLTLIEAMPLPLRPEALRAVASSQGVDPIFPAGAFPLDTAWAGAITRTRNLVFKEIDPQAQMQMLIDLDVAAWHVLNSESWRTGDPLKRECWKRLQAMPSAYWPPVLDAAVSRSRSLEWLDMKAIIEDDTIRFPSISDRVAVAFAGLPEMLDKGVLMVEMMRTRFGMTGEQYVSKVCPMEAIRLHTVCSSMDSAFSDFWHRHPKTDAMLREMTERIALERAFCFFWITGFQPKMSAAFTLKCERGDIEAVSEAARWRGKRSAFFLTRGPTVCLSPESGLPSQVLAQSLIDAISTLAVKMGDTANTEGCLNAIFRQPLQFQPVLLDRWALAIQWDPGKSAHVPLLASVSKWCADAVEVFVSKREYINAARACVAELHAYANITDMNRAMVMPILEAATQKVFDTMPSEAWGAMLAYLHSMAVHNGENPWVDGDTLDRLNGTFLRNPRATLREESGVFFHVLCTKAGRISDQLPDLVIGEAATFSVFCDRLAIPLQSREAAKRTILLNMGAQIPADTPHLRSVVRAALKRAGFNDLESFRIVLLDSLRVFRASSVTPRY